MGIRRRVAVGFLGIVVLLAVSGVIAYAELSRLSIGTVEILNASRNKLELTTRMLGAAQAQNRSYIHMTLLGESQYDSLCRSSMERLETTFAEIYGQTKDKTLLDSLSLAVFDMRALTDNYLLYSVDESGNLVDMYWYDTQYTPVYEHLVREIEQYAQHAQQQLVPRAEQLNSDVYRSVTPVLISTAVMILVVLLFFFLVVTYLVNPIVRMNRSLGQYIQFRVPFNIKAEFRDEVAELKEKIESLVNLTKNVK